MSCTDTRFTLSSVIQARRMAGRCDGCLQEGVRLRGKKDGDGEREERREAYFHLPSTSTSSSTLVRLWRGRGGTSWRQRAKHYIMVKLQNQTIKVRHALSLNTITWRLRMDNPLKPHQRKSEFWSGPQYVFTCKRSWYGRLFTWLQHVIQLENNSASCHKQFVSVSMKNSTEGCERGARLPVHAATTDV